MSLATTTVYLYIGLDTARRAAPQEAWPEMPGGHLELVQDLEAWAEQLEKLYTDEFAAQELSCCFDYEVTEELGAWLYAQPEPDPRGFADEARRLVAQYVLGD